MATFIFYLFAGTLVLYCAWWSMKDDTPEPDHDPDYHVDCADCHDRVCEGCPNNPEIKGG